jgi:hypothetical protein
MKMKKWDVVFKNTQIEHVTAFTMGEAIILAKAEQIKKGNSYVVAFCVDLKTKKVFSNVERA